MSDNNDNKEKDRSEMVKVLSQRIGKLRTKEDDRARSQSLKRQLLRQQNRISQLERKVSVNKRLRGDVRKLGGKKPTKSRRKRTGVTNGHSHLVLAGATFTSEAQGHKHRIGKNRKTALKGKTGHSHTI